MKVKSLWTSSILVFGMFLYLSPMTSVALSNQKPEQIAPDAKEQQSLHAKSNHLSVLNKNQDILDVNKREEARRIIHDLQLTPVQKRQYLSMLDVAVNGQEINSIVEVALMNSDKNKKDIIKTEQSESRNHSDIIDEEDSRDGGFEIIDKPLESQTYDQGSMQLLEFN